MDLRSRRKGSKEVREGRERGGIEGGRRGDTENAEVSEEEGRLKCMDGGGGGREERRGRGGAEKGRACTSFPCKGTRRRAGARVFSKIGGNDLRRRVGRGSYRRHLKARSKNESG